VVGDKELVGEGGGMKENDDDGSSRVTSRGRTIIGGGMADETLVSNPWEEE